MLTYKNVSKSYNSISKAIDNLNLQLESGKVYGLIGHNGAGKTTTLKMTVGILEPTEGSILLDGNKIDMNSVELKREIGYAPDSAFIPEVFTGFEYLNFISDIYRISSEKRKEKIKYLGDAFELLPKLNNPISSYSKGMKQKLVLIASLLYDPKLLILDEPLNGLDPQGAFNLKSFIKDYASKGNTVIFSTHILEVAEKLCDKIIIIDKSKLIYDGTLDDLKSKYPHERDLEDIFLKITKKKAS